MKHSPIVSTMLMGLCWLPVCSAIELPSELSGQGWAKIQFDCKSTLHDFTGHVACQPFVWRVLTHPKTGLPVVRGKVEVIVENMDTGNKSRDKKMHAMFQSNKFPRLHAAVVDSNLADCLPVQRVTKPDEDPKELPGRLPVLLKIREKEETVVAQIRHLHVDPNQITFTLNYELSLKSFGLKPPNVLGIIRVSDKVKLQANVTLKPIPAQAHTPWKEMTSLKHPALDPK